LLETHKIIVPANISFISFNIFAIDIPTTPVDPAGPDRYPGGTKPCKSNGAPKRPMADCSVTRGQLTLWRGITSGN
jgi:hypothetical protein